VRIENFEEIHRRLAEFEDIQRRMGKIANEEVNIPHRGNLQDRRGNNSVRQDDADDRRGNIASVGDHANDRPGVNNLYFRQNIGARGDHANDRLEKVNNRDFRADNCEYQDASDSLSEISFIRWRDISEERLFNTGQDGRYFDGVSRKNIRGDNYDDRENNNDNHRRHHSMERRTFADVGTDIHRGRYHGREDFEDRDNNYLRRNNSVKREKMLEITTLVLSLEILEDVDPYQVLTRMTATEQGEI